MTSKTEQQYFKDVLNEVYLDRLTPYLSKIIEYIAEQGDLHEFTKSLFLVPQNESFPAVKLSDLLPHCEEKIKAKYSRKLGRKLTDNVLNSKRIDNNFRNGFFEDCYSNLSEERKSQFCSNIILYNLDFAGCTKIFQYSNEYGTSFDSHLKAVFPNIHSNDSTKIFVKVRNYRNDYFGHQTQSIYASLNANKCENIINDALRVLTLFRSVQSNSTFKKDYNELLELCGVCLNQLDQPPLQFENIKQNFPDVDESDLNSALENSKQFANRYDKNSRILYFSTADELKENLQDYLNYLKNKQALLDVEEKSTGPDHINGPIQLQDDFTMPVAKRANSRMPAMGTYNGEHINEAQFKELTENSIFLADRSALMNDDARGCITKTIIPLLSKYQKKLWVSWMVRVEMYAIETNRAYKYTTDQMVNARKARLMLQLLHQKGYVGYCGNGDAIYKSSQEFIASICRNYPKQRFTIIVGSKAAMEETLDQTRYNCLPLVTVGDYAVKVRKGAGMKRALAFIYAASLNDRAEDDTDSQTDNSVNKATVSSTPLPEPSKEIENSNGSLKNKIYIDNNLENCRIAFTATHCTQETGELLPLSKEVTTGDELFGNDKRTFKVGKRIAEGGEGIIYHVDAPHLVAKVYKRDKLTKNRQAKLQLMISHNPYISQLCWPKELLFNKVNQCVGYLMDEVDERYLEFGESILQLQKEAVRNDEKLGLKGWNRETLVQTCILLSRTLSKIHKANIIIGDINPKNFMINVKSNVKQIRIKIVDCDSFQIGEYPCPVGTLAYTSPAIYERLKTDTPKFGEFLRTKEDDCYAFSSLLFRILMLGGSPTAGKGETNVAEAIRSHYFPYRVEGKGGEDTPDGPYRLMWNNIPSYIKKLFYDEFAGKRAVSPEEWLKNFEKYEDGISLNIYTDELIPTKYWEPKGKKLNTDFVCEYCGTETNMPNTRYAFKIEHDLPLLCNNCQRIVDSLKSQPAKVTCSRCGKIITTPAGRQTAYWYTLQHNFHKEVLCAYCWNKKRGNS